MPRPLAERGNAKAQIILGRMYFDGQGVPQDYSVAMSWWRKAAEQGNAEGQARLGILYRWGRGVPQDYVIAHMWFNLAARSGNEKVVEFRDEITARMTPAQIQEAQKLAREWKPKARSSSIPQARHAGRL
jgi:TPR repeat protein